MVTFVAAPVGTPSGATMQTFGGVFFSGCFSCAGAVGSNSNSTMKRTVGRMTASV